MAVSKIKMMLRELRSQKPTAVSVGAKQMRRLRVNCKQPWQEEHIIRQLLDTNHSVVV